MSGLSYSKFDQLLFSFCKENSMEEFSKTLLKAGLKESDYNCINNMEKTGLSKIRTGARNVTEVIVGFYCDQGVNERTAKYFQSRILCQIEEGSYLNLIKKINELIFADDSINDSQVNNFINSSKTARDLIESAMIIGDKNRDERITKANKKKEALEAMSKYLAEVFIYCIRRKNKSKGTLSLPIHNLMSQNAQFIGREDILQELYENFQKGNYIQILSGMPGVGKTQIALQFAYKNTKKYDIIWWINAENEATILEACSIFLQLKDASIINNIAAKFRNYFEQCSDSWLIIYDNVQYSSSEQKQLLDMYIPKNNKAGHILMTSREQNKFHGISPKNIDVFMSDDAVEFIQQNNQPPRCKHSSTVLGLLRRPLTALAF